MQNAEAHRPARLAIAALPGLDHFVGDLAHALPMAGELDVRVVLVRGPDDLAAILNWTDQPGDAVWMEFCWPPFPAMIASTEFGHRRLLVRVHRIEAYEADYVARTDWSRVDDLIVVSSDMARVVREVRPGIDGETRLHVVHNGVDLARAAAARTEFDRHRIGWCGAFIARKNPTLALQILHALHREDPRYTLHVAAQAVDRLTAEAFRRQTDTLGLNAAITFDGKVAAADMPAWHARNGVLLSTSLHESFGYAIAEAAMAGCDIAVLDHVGAAEFWPVETRFVAVADAVRMIREAAPDRWISLVAERFSLDCQVDSLRALLTAPRTRREVSVAPWSTAYWDARYRQGGNSGAGSSGRLARFKADTVNAIVAEHGVASVVEFGCGDGQQLALAEYPSYVGLDVSPQALRLCAERFAGDPAKRFLAVGEDAEPADLALSLDVVYHLVEDATFAAYMVRLFASARRLVVIYASDRDAPTPDAHVRHRDVSAWVARHAPDWRRVGHIRNPYPFDPRAPRETSFADFHIFARAGDDDAARLTETAEAPECPGRPRVTMAPHPSSADVLAARASGIEATAHAGAGATSEPPVCRCKPRNAPSPNYAGEVPPATSRAETGDIGGWPVCRGSARITLAPHPSSTDAIAAFTSEAEAATLGFFDAVLPRCTRMIDIGAYVGIMSLYAAHVVPEVHAIEASPSHQALLRDNLRRNPALAGRITLHPVAIGAREGSAALYRKAHADSGSSLFEFVERGQVLRGAKEADVPVRNVRTMLDGLGVDAATLVKIDIEGAEYQVLPALAEFFAARRPIVQVSFHPFNIVREDAYRSAVARIAAGMAAAEALAAFPYIYLPRADGVGWRLVEAADRVAFLTDTLLAPKRVPRIATPQYGFADAVGFAWERLPALGG